jgi:penicillin-binding protein 1A
MKDYREVLRHLKRVGKYAGLGVLGLGVASALTVFLIVRHFEAKLPSVEQLKRGYQPAQVTRVLARDGTLLGSVFTERRTVVSFKEVPSHVKLAFLAAEDASFYEHEGLDYLGMLRARAANVRSGSRRQGASTITQQVVKNLLLTPERTYERKIKETILARRLEQELGKDEILWLYLNHIFLGHGRYGVEEASRYYFARKARDLDLAEAALLAGIAPAPERLSPRIDATRALARRRYVLDQMLEKGFVTKELHDQALEAPLRLAPSVEEESELAPEIVSFARKQLDKIAGEQAKKGGYTIHTTIDPRLQTAARKAVRDGLASYAARQKVEAPFTASKRKLWGPPFSGAPKANKIYVGCVRAVDDVHGTIEVQVGDRVGRISLAQEERYNPKHLPPSEFSRPGALLRVSFTAPSPEAPLPPDPLPLRLELGPQAALVAIDPRTREVLALIGNHEAVAGGLDRATRASRQPGSAFKPFVYGYALASRRFTTASVLQLPPDPKAKTDASAAPRRLPVRLAIAKSDNAASEALLQAAGAPNVIEWAHALGIESELKPTLSLALGAYVVTPLEMANAYASFASGGEYWSAKLVSKIVGPDGKELPQPEVPPKRRAISEEEAYLVTSLMRTVVEKGTAQRASSLGRPLAGKTGTTNRERDAWFVGYSTELVASTWVGYDDMLPLGYGESGATAALPIWMAFMKVAHEGRPVTDFPRPNGIVTASIDPATGLLSYPGQTDAVEEEFLDGTVPAETSTPDAGAPEPGVIEGETGAPTAADAGAPTEALAVRPEGSPPNHGAPLDQTSASLPEGEGPQTRPSGAKKRADPSSVPDLPPF